MNELPITAREWPQRGRALAAWLDYGVRCFSLTSESNGSQPAPNSHAWFDQHTFVSEDDRLGAAGSWFALLTMAGAAELMQSLSVLYASSPEVPLTRGHIPLVRAIQEHLGRVVWLIEPGFHPADEPDDGSDDWEERHFRSILIAREWASDWVSSIKMNDPDGEAAEEASAESKRLGKLVKRKIQGSKQFATSFPGNTKFAERIEAVSDLYHQGERDVALGAPYKRFSETSHGLLLGLYSDKSVSAEGRYQFLQDNVSLDAIASRVAAWWSAALGMLCSYYGWSGPEGLRHFYELWHSLYDEV